MSARISRRRVLTIVGAAGGLGALGALAPWSRARAGARLYAWRGSALGAWGRIALYEHDQRRAERVIAACVAELSRLEAIFSLYHADSALSRLNREGRLAAPPPELVVLLAESGRISALTGGAFDATVQPLWQAYSAHFARPDADPAGPPPAVLARARGLVDWRGVEVSAARIALARPGMAVTLNGIAQGYITDRIADLLRDEGIGRVLVSLGEVRALEPPPEGGPWRVAIADPRNPAHALVRLTLSDGAIATSAGRGTRFDAGGQHHHLFDPATGQSAHHYESLTVIAPSATLADGLSTALYVRSPDAAGRILARFGDARAIALLADGRLARLAA